MVLDPIPTLVVPDASMTSPDYGGRLLLLSCSRRKRSQADLLPAIDRYDGPAFRVVRRYLRQCRPAEADIFILSAEYGLIRADTLIRDYDRRMTAQRAEELQPFVLKSLRDVFRRRSYQEIFVFGGEMYRRLLNGRSDPLDSRTFITCATGSLGRQLSSLHEWLHGSAPTCTGANPLGAARPARIRGHTIDAGPDEIVRIAREALANKRGQPGRYQSWYVQVGEQRVAPKWLVAQLTGLAPSRFGTSEALRCLTQLGVAARRVSPSRVSDWP